MFRVGILMTVPLVLLFFIHADAGTEPRRVGGRCEYASYSGVAKIISIVEKNDDRYEVKFQFTPHARIKELPVLTEKREFLMLIDNSLYPNRLYLKRNGIVADKIFDCVIKVIIKGSCTPILFEFPSMISVND
jgi:hypothetical protein